MKFNAKHGLETRLFESYPELFLVAELYVLDDVDSKFQSRLFGVAAVPLAPSSSFSEEHPFYHELPGDGLLAKVANKKADVHPSAALQVHVSDKELTEPSTFAVSKSLATKHTDFIRGYNRSIARVPIFEKLNEVFGKLKENGEEVPDHSSPERAVEEARRRINLALQPNPWASCKYLIPFDRTGRKVFVRVNGYLNLENDLFFSRCIVNPDPKGKKRQIHSPGMPDFDQSNPVVQIKAKEVAFDLQNFSLNHHLLLDVIKVEFNGDKVQGVKLVELGFCFLPLFNEDGYLNFGKFLAPVFTPPLDWSSVEEFAIHNPWDLLEIMLEENEQIKKTNRYAIISITDEYRKVRAADPRTSSRTSETSPRSTATWLRSQTKAPPSTLRRSEKCTGSNPRR